MSERKVDGKYVIVCSRGPGSETIVTRAYAVIRKDDGKLYYDVDIYRQQMEADGMEQEEINEELSHGMNEEPIRIDETWFGIEVMFEDEGPVLFMNEGTTNEDILKCLTKCFEVNDQELDFGDNEEMQNFMDDINEAKKETANAFMSAIIRSWLNPGSWTSVDAWRNLECEVMSKEDVDRYCEFTGVFQSDLELQGCKVLAECVRRYPDNLPKETGGC